MADPPEPEGRPGVVVVVVWGSGGVVGSNGVRWFLHIFGEMAPVRWQRLRDTMQVVLPARPAQATEFARVTQRAVSVSALALPAYAHYSALRVRGRGYACVRVHALNMPRPQVGREKRV